MTASETDLATAADDDSEDKPAHRRGHGRRFWIRLGVQLLLLVVAAVFVARRAGQLSHVGEAVTGARWPWLLGGAAALIASIPALSRLQQLLLREGQVRVSLRRLVLVTLASNAVTQSLPGGVVVAEGYAYRQYRRLGAPRVLAVWTEASAGALAAAALAALGFAGALLSPGGLRHALAPPLGVVTAGAVAAAALFRRTRLLAALTRRVLDRIEQLAPDSWCRRLDAAERAADQMRCFQPSMLTWLRAGGLAVMNWVLDAVVLACALRAVHASVPWHGILLAYAGAQLLAELPVTPGGLGVVEGGLVGLLTEMHVPGGSAIAATLLYRGLSFWFLIVLGWLAALRLRLRDRDEASTESTDDEAYPQPSDASATPADTRGT